MADEAKDEPRPPQTREKVAAQVAPTEEEIDSPDRKTLVLLSVVFVVTAVCWGSARFACNMHPPESRSAPKLPTERLIATPKDAAIEFVQRWRSNDIDGALEIATGPAAAELATDKAACTANANQCARDREAAAGRVTSGQLIGQDGFNGDVRVTTELKGKKETYRVRVHREDTGFKVLTKTLEPEGATTEPAPAHS
jgi:hypothetical protein